MSLGGMIAQELTLMYPERVRRLVLGCTFCGGKHSIFPGWEVRRALSPLPFRTREQRMSAILPFIYDSRTARERIEADLEVLRRNPPSNLGVAAQLTAIMIWDSYYRLPSIQSPTLVIHGETDRLIPPENARVLAARIPGAQRVIIPEASHIFPTDQPEATCSALLGFLASVRQA